MIVFLFMIKYGRSVLFEQIKYTPLSPISSSANLPANIWQISAEIFTVYRVVLML